MGVRASLSALLTATSLSGNARVSVSTAMIAQRLEGDARISGQYMMVVQSANRGLWMNLVDSNSAIFGAQAFTVSLAATPTPEYNPYKPVVPDELRDKLGADGYAYIEENQEILRQQHNLLQAGDTTFPYQLTIASHKDKQYSLGAVGRFYHEDYGVIQARYVQFKDMVHVSTPHCPVGLFHNKDSLEWVVTNDYSKSHPDLVVGISSPWTLPADSDFGWVIVDGPILQQVKNNSADFSLGEALAWDESGAVSNAAAGKVIGRRVNKTDITRLTPGSMWVRTESFSEAQINDIITAGTKSLLDELRALEHQIALLPSAGALRTLQVTVTSLRTTLSNEASARIAADLRLNERISNLDFVTIAQLNTAITAVQNQFAADFLNLSNTVDYIRTIALAANTRIDIIEGAETRLQSQIDAILGVINALNAKTRNKFPVVDGSVPPNLVYIPDGSLVYTEE